MLKKYRLTCVRTYRDDRKPKDGRNKKEHHVTIKASTDKEAIQYALEWLQGKHAETGVYHREIGVSYKFLRLEQVRDISKRCVRKLKEGFENEKK